MIPETSVAKFASGLTAGLRDAFRGPEGLHSTRIENDESVRGVSPKTMTDGAVDEQQFDTMLLGDRWRAGTLFGDRGRRTQTWFWLTYIAATMGLAVILSGFILAANHGVVVGVATTVPGVVIEAITALFFRTRRGMESNMRELEVFFREREAQLVLQVAEKNLCAGRAGSRDSRNTGQDFEYIGRSNFRSALELNRPY